MEKAAKILVVDDDHDVLLTARMFLELLSFDVTVISSPEKLLPLVGREDFDVILLDMNFQRGKTEGSEGLHWLGRIHELDKNVVVILMTAFGDVELAVRGIRSGAMDFILKPWQNAKLHASILSAMELKRTRLEREKYRKVAETLGEDSRQPFGQILGNSPAMEKLRESIRIIAPTDASVLVLGENGTGKELVARAIHINSERKNGVFLGVDMGAIPESLFESELFGHRKGSFTGALQDKPGRFELASGGTLFLDEIGNLPPVLQTRLLTVLEQKALTSIGSDVPVTLDIRLISATNRPLYQMVNDGRFRRDLIYRLNTIELVIPPLRERPEDIAILAGHFLLEACRKYDRKDLEIGKQGIRQLQSYSWPGNVRELQNTIVRAVIMSDDKQLRFDNLGFERVETPRPDTLNIEENEKALILKALQTNYRNVTRAAADLGIDRNALYRRMKKYGIQ
ncbi:MAG: sigma-54-dependent Fis family transcriptional regulator [Bacteroidetes bacterium]|nr:MAG: sigma-54-dependent Fis family transcriptional regulator [Bacteroidota bacterium]